MTQELKTVKVKATMETFLELVMNVPIGMTHDEIRDRIGSGQVDGGDLTEVKGSFGGWYWDSDIEDLDFVPEAPGYFSNEG